jgi:hypothetical protein
VWVVVPNKRATNLGACGQRFFLWNRSKAWVVVSKKKGGGREGQKGRRRAGLFSDTPRRARARARHDEKETESHFCGALRPPPPPQTLGPAAAPQPHPFAPSGTHKEGVGRRQGRARIKQQGCYVCVCILGEAAARAPTSARFSVCARPRAEWQWGRARRKTQPREGGWGTGRAGPRN